MEIEVLRPFGPSVVKIRLPESIISEMNNYTDDLIKDEEKSKKLDFGSQLVGNVHQEIL